VKARCAYCGSRAYVRLAGLDSRSVRYDQLVCPECGPAIAGQLDQRTVRLTQLADYRTVWRAIRLGLMWAAIILAIPFVAGMIYAAIEMITGK
jgi:hypothetical protein